MPRSHVIELETLTESGAVPESRLKDPNAVHSLVERLIQANRKRSATDAMVAGLFDGNPPYLDSALRQAAQSWRCNVNWRIAEAFLGTALTAYWDVISEAPSYCNVKTAFGNPEQREEWSGIISEEFNLLNKQNCATNDQSLNYMFRRSHHDMVLFRCGPVMFDDMVNFRSRAISQNQLLVPDRSPSCVNEWPLCVVRVNETVDRLYAFIRNPEAAARLGYNVKAVRRSIMNAVPDGEWPTGRKDDWEWYENHIRNNDLWQSSVCEMVPISHVYWREFPKDGEEFGKISHAIIDENDHSQGFLFRRVGRFDYWHQVIHPFYYDTGNGQHHSVKGLGIKAFGALETYNRMQCHAVDVGMWDSAMHFQAQDAASAQNAMVTAMGPFLIHQPGLNLLAFSPAGKLDGLMAVKQDTMNTVTANLAQYRQDVQRRRHGAEQPTATQVSYEAENENMIGRSGMSWYFEQLDVFYTERYRRATNPNLVELNPGGRDALAFQKACIKRGVPREALLKTESVLATRTVGYGSASARIQALNRILGRIPMYDEVGRRRILEDITAADVGRAAMRRYIQPESEQTQPGPHHSQAQDKVVAMKVGVRPLVTPDQNPIIFAGTYIQAAAEAAGSLEQGANPMEVYNFLAICGPAIMDQLQRIAQDPTRKGVYETLLKHWQQIASVFERLEQEIKKGMAERQKMQQQQQAQMNEQNVDMALRKHEIDGKLAISAEKARNNYQLREATALANQRLKEQQAAQGMALSDAEVAAGIHRDAAKTAADVANSAKKANAKSSRKD